MLGNRFFKYIKCIWYVKEAKHKINNLKIAQKKEIVCSNDISNFSIIGFQTGTCINLGYIKAF